VPKYHTDISGVGKDLNMLHVNQTVENDD